MAAGHLSDAPGGANELPVTSGELLDHFRQMCAEGTFVVQRCGSCSRTQYPPSPLCRACLSPALRWEEHSHRARLYSYTVAHRAPAAAFSEQLPYVLAIAELDPGVKMEAWLVDCAPDRIAIEMELLVAFRTIDGVLLPVLVPADVSAHESSPPLAERP